MWVVENINGDDSLVRKEFEKYEDAKAYSEWTCGSVFYSPDKKSVTYENGDLADQGV